MIETRQLRKRFGITGLILCLWLTPLALLVAAAQLACGLFAKTVKEAQQTLWLLSVLPVSRGWY